MEAAGVGELGRTEAAGVREIGRTEAACVRGLGRPYHLSYDDLLQPLALEEEVQLQYQMGAC